METTSKNQRSRGVAYSYVRFSAASQKLGDSLRRQVEMAEVFCERNGLELHPKTYRDLGVSAFNRRNVEKGALAAFIQAVESGKVPKGSYLVIEQFDRLSRADVDVALRLLLQLVQSGITVVTLVDERIWDSKAIKDVANLMLAIVFMSRANNESAAKAERLSSVWRAKKRRAAETGEIVTVECPRWLEVAKDKKSFRPLQDKVASIRNVFDMRIQGYGMVAIANRANKEGWTAPADSGTWHTSLVGRLLKNRALLGEYQPRKFNASDNSRVPDGEPIKEYYPRVLDEQTFMRAQAVGERRGKFPGRRDINCRNWLQGLLKCTCGQSFVRKNKTSAKQPGYARYYCTNRVRQVTKCPSVSATEIEATVIHAVSQLAPQFWSGTKLIEELTAKADAQQAAVSAAKAKRDRFAEAIGESTSPIQVLLERLQKAQTEVEETERALSVTRTEIARLGGNPDEVFESIVQAVKNADSEAGRLKLRENISRIISCCVVNSAGQNILLQLRGEGVQVAVPLTAGAAMPGIVTTAMTAEGYARLLLDEAPTGPARVPRYNRDGQDETAAKGSYAKS